MQKNKFFKYLHQHYWQIFKKVVKRIERNINTEVNDSESQTGKNCQACLSRVSADNESW